jgi:L-alanine-DL-glutamate epimerase-like enolase superfamily enzyme
MKITDIQTIPLSAPLAVPIGRSQDYSYSAKHAALVKIYTDEGIIGIGDALTPKGPKSVCAIIEEIIKPEVIGLNPTEIEVVWERMYRTTRSLGCNKGFMMMAIAAIDIGLWDILGKALGLPVYQLLGGSFRKNIKTYASSLYFAGRTTKELVEAAESFIQDGFTAIKLKVGAGPQTDIENVKAIRKAIGEEIGLMVDANGGYDRFTAIKIGREFERYNVFWFEEPIANEDIEGYIAISKALDMPVAAGECEFTRYGFKELLTRGAVDIVQPDVSKAGGISECRKIANMASAFNVPYAPHVWGSAVSHIATLHLAAAIPNFLICETDRLPNPLREDLLTTPLEIKNSFSKVPEKPGLGIELNEEMLKKYSI